MIRKNIVIQNVLGLHARSANCLAQAASKFSSDIYLINPLSNTTANAKSVINLLMLSASKGTLLELTVCGNDCEEAFSTIEKLVNSGFGE